MVFNLRIDTTEARREAESLTYSFRQLESIAMRYLLIARRMGLPEEAEGALQKISMMIVAIRQLELTIQAAQAALAGAGPIGWLALGASAAYTALSFYSLGNQ